MLAEPRRKQKLSVDPRGLNWSKDESKFGQKMLEKFGWSKGKGLGAKEDGNVTHVKVSVKNNNHGLGCSKTQVDNWIAHQDDFNALLANLNQSNQLTDTDKVISLENKSKTSRSRVHYKKFTKGKDLSAKSAEDLDCIFGRRSTKKMDNTTTSGSADEEEDECKTGEKTGGFITVNSDDNIQNYFAKKMANLKKTRSSSQPELQSILKYHFTENDNDEVSNDSFGKSSYKRVSFVIGDYDENEDSKSEESKINESGDNSDCKKLKKKKSKKRKLEKIEQTEEENLTGNMTSPNNPTIKKKKTEEEKLTENMTSRNNPTIKKKKKEYSQTEEVEENREKGKKKIKKEEEMQNCENVDVIKDNVVNNDLIKDKKKSKKRTDTYKELSADGTNLIHAIKDVKKQLISIENDAKKKKHKTKKLLNEEKCQKREKKKNVVKMAPKIILDFEEAFKGSNISTIEGYALETGYDVDFIKKQIKKRQKMLC